MQDIYIWDADALVSAFGGITKLRRLLFEYKVSPPAHDTIRRWRYRKTIPADVLAAMAFIIAHEETLEINLNDFVGRKPRN